VDAEFVITDKAYDSYEVILSLSSHGMVPTIPTGWTENFSASVTNLFIKSDTPSKIPSCE
jgi:hypothetical protein